MATFENLRNEKKRMKRIRLNAIMISDFCARHWSLDDNWRVMT
jgi:hypothetical protein